MEHGVDVRSLEFADDSSRILGLSHSAMRAEETVSVDDTTKPIWKTLSNPLLISTEWLSHNNRRLTAELKANGEPLPPEIIEGPNRVRLIVDRDVEEQVRAEVKRLEKERPDLTCPDRESFARMIVAGRQTPTHRNEGAYDDVRSEIARVGEEYPGRPGRWRTWEALSRVDARRLAAGGVDRMDGGPRKRDPDADYLGDTIQNLMKPSTEIEHGGSRNGKHPAITPLGADTQVRYDYMMGDAV